MFDTLTFKPDEVVCTIVQSACAHLCDDRAMRIGKQLMENFPESCKRSDAMINSRIFMLMKFGNVIQAEQVFREMKHKTIYTYGAMMKGESTVGLMKNIRFDYIRL